MRVLILLTAYLLYAAHAAPQFVTFEDGKIGVNFGGYHAEAGLGGLLTGNRAHGGLSASAGTPWGQNAAAGLGGSLDGRSSGFGYGGAQAIPSVGASAAFGGTTGENGFIGSEAHANGKTHSNTITSAPKPLNQNFEPHSTETVVKPAIETRFDAVQKIKPPKKYSLIKTEESLSSTASAQNTDHAPNSINGNDTADTHIPTASNSNPATLIHKHRQRMRERRRLQQQQQETQNELEQRRKNEHRIRIRERLNQRQHVVESNKDINVYPTSTEIAMQRPINSDDNAVHSKHLVKTYHKSVNTQSDSPAPPIPAGPGVTPGMLNNIFNIPIGILRTIQESLTGIQVEKNLAVTG